MVRHVVGGEEAVDDSEGELGERVHRERQHSSLEERLQARLAVDEVGVLPEETVDGVVVRKGQLGQEELFDDSMCDNIMILPWP